MPVRRDPSDVRAAPRVQRAEKPYSLAEGRPDRAVHRLAQHESPRAPDEIFLQAIGPVGAEMERVEGGAEQRFPGELEADQGYGHPDDGGPAATGGGEPKGVDE